MEDSVQLILEVMDIPRFNPMGRPQAQAGTAVVLWGRGDPTVIGEDGRLAQGTRWGVYNKAYRISLQRYHHAYVIDELPSSESAFPFSAEVRLSYRVSNPIEIVSHNLTDPRESIEQKLYVFLSNISRQYASDAHADAKSEIQSRLQQVQLGDTGIRITDLMIKIEPDPEVAAYIRKGKVVVYEVDAERDVRTERGKVSVETDEDRVAAALAKTGDFEEATILTQQLKEQRWKQEVDFLDDMRARGIIEEEQYNQLFIEKRMEIFNVSSTTITSLSSGVAGDIELLPEGDDEEGDTEQFVDED